MRSSTLQLLRFHFSFFLMPVFWFGLSQVQQIHWGDAALVFLILHGLVYPASNGYNSYMDRDTGSIGGVKNPLPPTKQLFYISVMMDFIAVVLGWWISLYFSVGVLLYILASRAYSYRGIRLKQYPIIGYVTVVLFQGAGTFWLVMHGCSKALEYNIPVTGMAAAALLIGGFYPLTQIYQHEQDKADGVNTLSLVLGYRGTFLFTALVYIMAMATLAFHLFSKGEGQSFLVMQFFFIPVLVYFFWWFYQVYRNQVAANYVNTMRMNILASVCSNAAFICLLIISRN